MMKNNFADFVKKVLEQQNITVSSLVNLESIMFHNPFYIDLEIRFKGKNPDGTLNFHVECSSFMFSGYMEEMDDMLKSIDGAKMYIKLRESIQLHLMDYCSWLNLGDFLGFCDQYNHISVLVYNSKTNRIYEKTINKTQTAKLSKEEIAVYRFPSHKDIEKALRNSELNKEEYLQDCFITMANVISGNIKHINYGDQININF